MKKLLVSIFAGKAERMINSKKPSSLIPFKGDFPLLKQWRRDDWNEIIDRQVYVEDCPRWAQNIMIQGARMFDVENGFTLYLKENNISQEEFNKRSSGDKTAELIRFLNAGGLTLNSLKIEID